MGKNQPEEEAEQSQPKNGENKNNSKGIIILGVYMHCQGCADEVVKSLRGFEGVEVIETDMKNRKVTVKGKKADPIKVTERLRKKTGKHVQLISPIPPTEKKEEKKEKKQEPKVIEVVLKIYLHCEGCAKDVKSCIHKMPGVQTVDTDMKKSLVTVKGVFEPEKLVKYVIKKAGKHAEIAKTEKKDNKGEQKDNKNEKEGNKEGKKESTCHKYPPELVYAPQLFSDENPNACLIM